MAKPLILQIRSLGSKEVKVTQPIHDKTEIRTCVLIPGLAHFSILKAELRSKEKVANGWSSVFCGIPVGGIPVHDEQG